MQFINNNANDFYFVRRKSETTKKFNKLKYKVFKFINGDTNHDTNTNHCVPV